MHIRVSLLSLINTVSNFLQPFLPLPSPLRLSSSRAVKRSMVDYALLDPVGGGRQLGIETDNLKRFPKLWASGFYQSFGWRVVRDTGVDTRSMIGNAAVMLEKTTPLICELSLALQALWLGDGVRLGEGEEGSMHGHDDGTGGHAAAAPCDRLCTAVHLRSNQRNLPMDVTEFVETVQRECAQEGNNLRETWLHRAEETVNDFHMSLIEDISNYTTARTQAMRFGRALPAPRLGGMRGWLGRLHRLHGRRGGRRGDRSLVGAGGTSGMMGSSKSTAALTAHDRCPPQDPLASRRESTRLVRQREDQSRREHMRESI